MVHYYTDDLDLFHEATILFLSHMSRTSIYVHLNKDILESLLTAVIILNISMWTSFETFRILEVLIQYIPALALALCLLYRQFFCRPLKTALLQVF